MDTPSSNTAQRTDIAVEEVVDIKEPDFYQVILINDDYTPMDFVIDLLMKLFAHSYEKAYRVTLTVHQQGQGVAGIFPKEIAIEKMIQTLNFAKNNDFPLRCTVEKN